MENLYPDIIKYLIINNLEPNDCKNLLQTCKKLFQYHKFFGHALADSSRGIETCVIKENLLAIKLLRNQQNICLPLLFLKCCHYGKINIAQWLYSSDMKIEESYYASYLWVSCTNNHIEMAQWLYMLANDHNFNEEISIKNILIDACEKGNLEIAKWIYTLTKPQNNIKIENKNFDFNHCFRNACYNGHLNIAQWLYKLYTNNEIHIDMSPSSDLGFYDSCRNGHYEIAEWLYQIILESESYIFLEQSKLDDLFLHVCTKNYLKIAKLLIKMDDDKYIDIHQYNELIFINNCRNGNLEMAQWLYQIAINRGKKINIHVQDETPFYTCCICGHFEIAQWIYEVSIQEKCPIHLDKSSLLFYTSNQKIKNWLQEIVMATF